MESEEGEKANHVQCNSNDDKWSMHSCDVIGYTYLHTYTHTLYETKGDKKTAHTYTKLKITWDERTNELTKNRKKIIEFQTSTEEPRIGVDD